MSIATPTDHSEPVRPKPGCLCWGAGSAPRNPLYATEKIPAAFACRDSIISDLTPLPRRIGAKLRRSLRRRAATQPYPAGLLAFGSSPVPRLPIQFGQWLQRGGYPITVAPPQRILTAFPIRAGLSSAPSWVSPNNWCDITSSRKRCQTCSWSVTVPRSVG